MTQQINLYQPKRYERHVPFSAARMASIMAVVFFLLLAAGAIGYWRFSALTARHERLQARRNDAVQRIADYQHRYPPRTPDPDLVQKVTAMANERDANQALIKLLSDGQAGNCRGLSDHLAGLAKQDLSTLWLRRIRLSAGGDRLLLEGSSTRAADVPLYLQRLSGQAVFAGRVFDHLQLNREESNPSIIDFLLQTTREDKP